MPTTVTHITVIGTLSRVIFPTQILWYSVPAT